MKIRRYMGKDTQEAILKVKMDLGNEAVILNTRKVRQKGLLKLFSKPLVEVLAAVDEDYGKRNDNRNQDSNRQKPSETDKPSPLPEKDEKINELESKVNNMEAMLKKIYEQTQPGDKPQPNAANQAVPIESKILELFYGNIVKNEVDPEIARRILDIAAGKMSDQGSVNEAAAVIYNIIAGMLGKPETIRLREDGKPTVVIFVGPTGVGKTTTMAKIAANYALNHKKKVGFITADTYRIAAVEQLKTYAEILGIPVSVVYSPNEIKEAIASYSDSDLIFIDTAGRSYNNKTQFDELKTLIQTAGADETFLLMNALTSIRNCREIIKHYSFLKDYKLIFTKLDETTVTGIILNTRIFTGKSLSYMTTGQSVPDDIEIANVEKIAKTLLGSIN